MTLFCVEEVFRMFSAVREEEKEFKVRQKAKETTCNGNCVHFHAGHWRTGQENFRTGLNM